MNFGTANTGVVLYQLSYKANWELVTLWIHNIPIDGKECNWLNKIWYIWTAEKDIKPWVIIAVTHTNLSSCQIKEIFRFFNFTTDSCNDQSCCHLVCFVNTPLDSDLSSGWYYPAFEQLRPGNYMAGNNTPWLRFKLLHLTLSCSIARNIGHHSQLGILTQVQLTHTSCLSAFSVLYLPDIKGQPW